jgi:uncharacterized membrane protein
MPWLKFLHIAAVVVWCGALLYLPSIIGAVAATALPGARHEQPRWQQLPRSIFIGIATPAALLAIASGTLIFVSQGLLAPWLMFKLAGVGLLVMGHGTCGYLVLRTERGESGGVPMACHVVLAFMVLCLLGIAWLVLRKPV